MDDKVLRAVFLSSLMMILSLSVGMTCFNELNESTMTLKSNSQPQASASNVEVFTVSNSDCESIDLSSEITYYTCRSTHPDAGSFYAVFDGQKMNYFNNANFGGRALENHAITLDQDGHVHLAYVSKTWVTYGSDPLGAGYEVQSVHYAFFNGTSWENRIVISDSTEERSWWEESFGSLQLVVETGVQVHLTYVHRLDEGNIVDYIRHWKLENEEALNFTLASMPWNGNELTPTFLKMNSEGRLYLTYYNNDGLALLVKNPDSTVWFGSEIDIASEIALPLWSDDRRTFAPHSSALGINDQLHLCYYDTENQSLMYTTNSTSLTQFALDEVPIQWSTTTISTNSSIQTGMLCSLAVDLSGDIHLFYSLYNDNTSSLMHGALHDGSWYLSELYNAQGCEQNGLSCYSGSLPIYSDSKAYVRLGDEMLQISWDEDYENRTDYDSDGVINRDDAFPFDDSEQLDYDLDGIGDNADIDDDNDGVDDLTDLFPFNDLEQIDSDGDGIGDYADLDDDNDGYADEVDMFPMDSTENNDTDSDGIGNNADTDDDDDGWSDTVEGECMSDPLNKTDTPPDLNSNSICDQIENYTYVPETDTEQSSNTMLIGTAGMFVLILSALVVLFLKRSKNEDEDWFEEEEELYEEMARSSPPVAKDDFPSAVASRANPDHVDSWEDLPDGEWLENDADGTHWYRTNDGVHWYSTDDGYRVWDES